MSEMIDRVARALFEAYGCELAWEELGADQNLYRAMARAAIEAMREPTTDMAVAYEKAVKRYVDKLPPNIRHLRHPYPRGYMVAEAVKLKIRYQAMIDAALR